MSHKLKVKSKIALDVKLAMYDYSETVKLRIWHAF